MIFEQMELNRPITINETMNKKMRSSLLWCLPFISVLLWINDSYAQQRTITFKQGAIMARSLALDENKQPILVEYNEKGEEVSVVPISNEYKANVAKLKVITAFEYHQEKARLDKYEEIHKNDLWQDAEVMSLDKFRETEFIAADGETTITVPTLPSYVKSVLVRGRSARINPDPKELVLLSFSVDLSEEKTVPEKGSLVINDKGQVIHSSTNNIAPRVGFFGDPKEKQEFYASFRKPEDQIFGPVKYVKIYVSPEVFPGSMTASDYRGKYAMSFMLPYCPGGLEFTTDVWAELRYANFSPHGSPTIPYYLRRQDWTYCYDLPPFAGGTLGAAMDYINAMGVIASRSIPMYNIDFKVDVMFLSGRIILRNPDGSPITVGTATTYEAEAPDGKRILQENYDFDGDGKKDRVVLGRMVNKPQEDGSTKKVFEAYPAAQASNVTDENALQGVFLSGSDVAGATEPDFVRLADTKKRFTPNGKLKTISTDDFKNTDIYVFRESTGQLVLERNGLKDEEIASRVDIGLGKDDKYYYYRLMLRGPMDTAINIGAINRSKNWEEWAEEYRLAEPFRKRESDYLKSGEWIRLVVINRATGYMGTQRIQLGDASKNAGSMLSVKLDDTYLQPPNLKIWAERKYTPEKGIISKDPEDKEKHYLIGQEGAALTTDTLVEVFTEWLDEEGRPLPEGLGADDGQQYGLSGRLARTSGKDSLSPVGNGDLANFAIPPGRNIQVLKISDNLTSPENFYVHVVGMQKDESPDFGGGNTAENLKGRPNKFTPFLTPLYDENKNWQTWSAYQQLKQDWADEENPDENDKPAKPLPFYVWGYRPEYQFSQYKLEVAELNRVTTDDAGTEEKTDIYDAKTPVIASSDKLVELLYSLIGPNSERLSAIDGPQDLVFALGEEEIKVEIGSDKQIRFENIEHLAGLMPEDYLTLRLYSNQDAGNVLWEYAFEHLVLVPNIDPSVVVKIPADNNQFAMSAIYLGYHSRSADKKTPQSITWEVDGSFGHFSPSKESAAEAVFASTLNTTRTSTDHVTKVTLRTIDGQEIAGPRFKVVPGVPDEITVETEGEATIAARGEITLTVTVKDKHNNKIADGTEVKVSADSDLVIEGNGLTADGETQFKIKGYHTSGDKNLKIVAGQKEYSHTLNITPLDLSVSVPSNVETGSTVPVTVTASAGDIDINGLTVELRTDSGKVQSNVLSLASGRAATQLAVGNSKGGGTVLATIAGAQAAASYTTDLPSGLSIPEMVLVGDKPANGTVTVDKGNGESFQQEFVVSTEITVKGAPGEVVPVAVGDLANPAIEPLVYYNMNNVYGDQVVGDAYGVIDAQWQALNQAEESNGGFDGSYSFNSASTIKVPLHSAFNKTGNIGVGFEAKLRGPGLIVSFNSAGQRLELTSDHKLRFTQTTETGDETLEISDVEINKWHRIGAHYQNGKLQLQVGDQHAEKTISGNAEPLTSADAITIGGGFQGLLNQFRVIDWNAPRLAALPNGNTSMSVTIGASGEAKVRLASSAQMGKRTIARFDPHNPLGLPIESAYAQSSSGSSWWGKVKAGAKQVAVGFVDSHTYAAQTALAFGKGLVLGDTSTPAGMLGDMVMGFIPFGDSRDVALQNYYKNYGNPEDYDEVVLYLAYIGLGADALMLIPATTAVGTPLNAAIAVIKPAVKLIRRLPMRGVLAKELSNMGQLAVQAKKSGDWSTFKNRAEIILPFLQLFAAVALDEDLRNLLANAVRNSVDFENWLKYLAMTADELVAQQPTNQLIPEAYAGISATKQILRRYDTYLKRLNQTGEKAGAILADSVGAINEVATAAKWPTRLLSEEKALIAVANIGKLGGFDALAKMRNFSSFGRRSVDEVTDDLGKIDLSPEKFSDEAVDGMKKLLSDLGAKGNLAKGAAHQLHTIKVLQEKGYKIVNIEATEIVQVPGIKFKNMRRYDIVVEIGGQRVRVECKSWLPENAAQLTKRYLKTKLEKVNLPADSDELIDAAVEGQQLFADIISWSQKGFKEHQWHLDDAAAANHLKATLLEEMKTREMKVLLIDIFKDEKKVDQILKGISDNIKDFVVVVPKV